MNIFKLSSCPIESAKMMVDSHVSKMILESIQVLSTAHRVLDGEMYYDKTTNGRRIKRFRLPDSREEILYKATHVNHPSSVWARTTNNNYTWLHCHCVALSEEFTYRYSKVHKSSELLDILSTPPTNIEVGPLTLVPSAMGIEYIISTDPIVNYRNYYANGKKHLHSWKKRAEPEWIKEYQKVAGEVLT